MPELPEVQTTVNGLNAHVRGLTIVDVWTSYNSPFHAEKENIKNPEYFKRFKRCVVGNSITSASRIGKNVLIHLDNGFTILTHMKMTGHYLVGHYTFSDRQWKPTHSDGPLNDPFNRHIRMLFTLSDGSHLAFSDARKFAKIFVFETASKNSVDDLALLGPDPLSKECTLKVFTEQLHMRPNTPLKQVLIDQSILSGIGNIYSDEMLWAAGIHPLSRAAAVPAALQKALHAAALSLLKRGINLGGDSDSDYRTIEGTAGTFQNRHKAYRRTGEPCSKNDGGSIERIIVAGRSAHFCPVHQIKY